MTSRLRVVGWSEGDPQLSARFDSIQLAFVRTVEVVDEQLVWADGLDEAVEVVLIFGDSRLESRADQSMVVLERRRSRKRQVLELYVGIPVAKVPQNTPSVHIACLRLMLELAEFLAAELKVPPPQLRMEQPDEEPTEPAESPDRPEPPGMEEILDSLVDEEGSFFVAKLVDLEGPGGGDRPGPSTTN